MHSGSTSFQVTIRLYRGSSLIAEKTRSYATRSSVKTFEVHFPQVISIRAGVTYTATAKIVTSANSFAHSDGVAIASCFGVTVNFKSKSSKDSNGSRQSEGQIQLLIYFISLYFSTIGLGKQIISTKVVSFNIVHYFHSCCASFDSTIRSVYFRAKGARARVYVPVTYFLNFIARIARTPSLFFCKYHER